MNTEITFLYEFALKADAQERFHQLVAELTESVAQEKGTQVYACYATDETDKYGLLEVYANSDAVREHMTSFSQHYAERFMDCVDLQRVTMLGQPDAALAELIAPMFSGAAGGPTSERYSTPA